MDSFRRELDYHPSNHSFNYDFPTVYTVHSNNCRGGREEYPWKMEILISEREHRVSWEAIKRENKLS